MLRDAHVVDIRGRNHVVRHGDGFLPETEIVNAVRTLRYGKVAFTVSSLHTDYQQIFALPLHGTGIKGSMTHDALHQVGIIVFVEVVLPLQRHMLGSHHRILVLLINTVPPLYGFVLPAQQLFVVLSQCSHSLTKITHYFMSFRNNTLSFLYIWRKYAASGLAGDGPNHSSL